MFEKKHYCEKCNLTHKCHSDRVCLNCGELKKSVDWCIKNSEILCVPCFEKGNYEPLYLIKEKLG